MFRIGFVNFFCVPMSKTLCFRTIGQPQLVTVYQDGGARFLKVKISDSANFFLLMSTLSSRKLHKSLIKNIIASGLKLFLVGDEALFNPLLADTYMLNVL